MIPLDGISYKLCSLVACTRFVLQHIWKYPDVLFFQHLRSLNQLFANWQHPLAVCLEFLFQQTSNVASFGRFLLTYF